MSRRLRDRLRRRFTTADRKPDRALFEPLEGRKLLHGDPGFVASVNFQPDGTATPAGYLADVGRGFGDRGDGLSYGWLDRAGGSPADNDNTRSRGNGASPDKRFDTLNHMGYFGRPASWEIAVPDGPYDVRLVGGDPSYTGQSYQTDVEGVAALRGSTSSSNRWIDRTVRVNVTDGRLSITTADPSDKLAFVEIAAVAHDHGDEPTPPAPPTTPTDPAPGTFGATKFNFQPAGAPTPAGHVADVGQAYGDRGDGRTFGWRNGTTGQPTDNAGNARDRNDGRSPDQRYDTLSHLAYGGRFTWELAVPNGSYTVRVVSGDPTYTGSDVDVRAEGTTVVSGGTTASSRFLDGTATVTVSDGALTISSGANSSNKINFLEVAPAGGTTTPTPPPTDPTPPPTNPTNPNPTPTSWSINFTKQGVPFPGMGFYNDFGNPYGTPGNDYPLGWVDAATGQPADNTGNARDRDNSRSPDQRYDTLNHFAQGRHLSWEIKLPDGRYRVRVVAGDPSFPGSGYDIRAEGTPVVQGAVTSQNPWLDGTVEVNVTDGRLTISSSANSSNKIAFLKLDRVGDATATPPTTPTPPPTPPTTPADQPTTIAWRSAKAPPVSLTESNTAVVNGELYRFGGFTSVFRAQKNAYAFDPATNTWRTLTNVPTRLTHAGTAVGGDTVYLVGGYLGNETANGAELPGQVFGTKVGWAYDTRADAYTRLPDLPVARAAGSAAVVGRTLHYFGGQEITRTRETPDHYALDLDNPSAGWRSLAPMPHSRNHAGAVVLGGKIYVVGGQTGYDSALVPHADVQVYDPAADRWSGVAALPDARSHIANSTFVYRGRIYAVAGERNHNDAKSSVYRYDPAADRWDALPSLPDRRISPSAGVIGDTIYVSGGHDGGVRTNAWAGVLS